MKFRNFLLLFLLCCVSATAVEYKISGIVVDATGQPLPSATVLLYKQGATDYDKGEATDMEGQFVLTGLSQGNYRMEISFMGFRTKKIDIALTEEKPEKRYSKIILQEDAALLTAVEVSAKRASLQVDIDKKTFLVNESAVSDGMSASEVLKEIPSVDVDVEGNVSMRNNENVEIYINGKPSGLSDDNKGDILEQLPAGSIEKIEVITNPSSKFDAEGSAGIINIVMKKSNDKASYYGSVSAGISYPWGGKPGGNVGGNINFSRGKWSSYVNVGYTNRKSIGHGETNRESYRTSDTILLNQNSHTDFVMNTAFLRMGTDCQVDSMNRIGLSGMFSFGGRNRDQFIDYDKGYLRWNEECYNSFQSRNSFTDNNRIMGNATVDYEHSFAESHTLSTSFTFSANKNDNERTYEQKNYDSLRSSIQDLDYVQEQHTLNYNRNFDLQVDYLKPISSKSKLEAGVKLSFLNQYSDVNSSIQKADATEFVAQHELDNDFELHQKIYAGYVSYGNKFGRFAMQLGLRGELTDPDWKLNTTGEESTKDPYFKVFPTAFFSYALSDKDELQLSYTRRISRPRRMWLNPYVNVSDSTNITFGNPDLDPEFTNSLECNYVKNFKKHTFMASLYYQLMQDVIQRYSWMVGESMMNTFANMTTSHSTGLELIMKNNWKSLSLTSNVNMYYYKLNGGDFVVNSKQNGSLSEVEVSIDDRESFSWTAQLSADFSLPKDFNLQLTGNYRSPRATAQGKSLSSYFVNMGLKKPFLKKKLVATISVRDLLNSRKWKSETWNDTFYQYSESSWSGRMLNFNLTYNFGNMSKTNSKKNTNGQSTTDEDVFEDF